MGEKLDEFLGGRVIVKTGDITEEAVDALVNAANATLLGGGGVDGAIHRAGGRQIYQECLKIRETVYPEGLPPGKAVITGGGNLKARFVIHTVGPIYGRNDGQDDRLLAGCYQNSLKLAVEHSLQTVAFPSISTGAFGFPKHEAAPIVSRALTDFLSGDETISQVFLVFFSEADARKFLKHQSFE